MERTALLRLKVHHETKRPHSNTAVAARAQGSDSQPVAWADRCHDQSRTGSRIECAGARTARVKTASRAHGQGPQGQLTARSSRTGADLHRSAGAVRWMFPDGQFLPLAARSYRVVPLTDRNGTLSALRSRRSCLLQPLPSWLGHRLQTHPMLVAESRNSSSWSNVSSFQLVLPEAISSSSASFEG